jgi:hypothetical protein
MKTLKFWAALLVLIFGSCLYYGSVLAHGPDMDLTFVRDVPTNLTPEYLDKVINEIPHWPNWFYFGAKANQLDFRGMPYPLQDQNLARGAVIEMLFDPHRLERDRFTLKYQVLEYIPHQKMTIRVVFDSKKALTKLFDRIDWTIEFLPNPRAKDAGQGTLIRGTEIVHTSHWRSRLFGRLFPSIFLNQIFYPNLLTLADIKNPDTVHPFPADN